MSILCIELVSTALKHPKYFNAGLICKMLECMFIKESKLAVHVWLIFRTYNIHTSCEQKLPNTFLSYKGRK